jgi:hypothetical protein
LAVSLGVIATHQSLARFYQMVFSESERRERSTGTYGPAAVAVQTRHVEEVTPLPPQQSVEPQEKASLLSRVLRSEPFRNLRALRAEPPPERVVSDAPRDFRLPKEPLRESQPVVLTRPKR